MGKSPETSRSFARRGDYRRAHSRASLLLIGALLAVLAGCGHGQVRKEADPRALLEQACLPGAQVRSARGSVWLKARSKEASGQFPALIDAPSPERLKMEVTNLAGGTEAIISVDGRRYSVDVPTNKKRSQRGEVSWGGIPLQWANRLFLGRIPCPEGDMLKDARFSTGPEGELVVETVATVERFPEKYVYRLRPREGTLWPESLHWERQGMQGSQPVTVDFKFEDPEAKTRSPRRWEAKGAQGEVKVRWRDRQIDQADQTERR